MRVAAAQLGPIARDESRAGVVERLIALLGQAAADGAELVAFPELALTTFFPRWVLDGDELDAFYGEMAAYSTDAANTDTIFLWHGPLNLQDGTELAPEGEPVALLDVWFIPQLLEGMTGASE